MNICLIVVDSLRKQSLDSADGPRTPFLDDLASRCVDFSHAYATECWTLPTHLSMFTGALPSEHGAHFQTLSYTDAAPTIAEALAAGGFHTEVVTRNSVFDGTLPGVTRGFLRNTQVFSDMSGLNPMSLVLALSKPRFRRQVETSGFFHPLQRASREFIAKFARATVPADREALRTLADRMQTLRDDNKPFFLFANLYDVHAPYPPAEGSIFRPLSSWTAVAEALRMPIVLPRLGGHEYLREGFRMSARNRELLLGRYHTSIELSDAKLGEFFADARSRRLLDDTLVIVTSDHGEAFGDHDLYLHDSSVWQTHLHVPLYVHHPAAPPRRVADVVSTRDLFGLMNAAAQSERLHDTILDADYRARHPVAVAQHFISPHARHAAVRHRQNLAAAICGRHKIIVRPDGAAVYDLASDPHESCPQPVQIEELPAILKHADTPPALAESTVRSLRAPATYLSH